MATLPEIPGYEIHTRLGAGGMGIVYSATRKDVEYKYAIKMLLVGRHATLEHLARFRIEAEAYACLNHRSIIKIRDVGVVCGCPFLVMDYAEHGSLDSYLKEKPELDIAWRLQLIREVADALAHAHGRRILHRDLKPANILIAADGSPRVSDFGLVKFTAPVADVNASCCTFSWDDAAVADVILAELVAESERLLPIENGDSKDRSTIIKELTVSCAKRSDLTTDVFDLKKIEKFVNWSIDSRRYFGEMKWMMDDMTMNGDILGSPRFMSPEQAQGRSDEIGPHTDIYGLGATLYSVLTGKPPYWEFTTSDVIVHIMRNCSGYVPTLPSALNPAVSMDLDAIVMKALAKQPGARYANMEMFGEDIDRVLMGRTPLARLHMAAT